MVDIFLATILGVLEIVLIVALVRSCK